MEEKKDNPEQQPSPETKPEVKIDQQKLDAYMQELRTKQSLSFAMLGGLAACLIGAVVWAVVTVVTNYQIGWMAIGVGFLVGFGVRLSGKGIDTVFGIVGASFAILGCIFGNVFTVCYLASREFQVPFFEVLSRLSFTGIFEAYKAMFQPIDLLFYGLALYEGYQFSFRRITQQELDKLIETKS